MWDHEIMGLPVTTSETVPLGEAWVIGTKAQCVIMNPWTHECMKHGGTPLYTRHMRGSIEAERDRRRHGQVKPPIRYSNR